MEPFAVICETCRARLKVRDESAIGQIHACPKCGSMVQIARPTGAAASVTRQSATLSTAVTIPAFDLPAEITAPQPEHVAAVVAEAVTPAVPATVASVSPLVLWGAGAAVLLAIGGVAIGTWLARDDAANAPPVAAASVPAVNAEEPAPAIPKEKPAAEQIEAATDNIAEVEPTSPAADPPSAPVDASPEPAESSEVSAPTQSVGASANVGAATPSVETSATTSEPAVSKNERAPVLEFDPLDFDPSELIFTDKDSSPAAPPGDSIPKNGEIVVEEATEEAHEAVALPPPVNERTLSVRLGPMPNGAARPGNVATQLGMPLNGFEATDVSLARFVEMISEMADVPITLDPAALAAAGVSPRTTVRAKAPATTLDKLLRETLAKHRLESVESAWQLRVAMTNADRPGTVDYDVQDLVGTGDGKQLVELVERFVVPATWQRPGAAPAARGTITLAGTKLHVESEQAVRHQVLIFCERLRLARGLAPRSRYPKELLTIESPHAAIAEKLAERATFTFLPWTRLADVVSNWQETSGLTILVDWSALASMELAPSSPVACSAIDRTWRNTLDGICKQLGLAWWPVDGDTIQITTPDALSGIERIEFYAIPKDRLTEFADMGTIDEPSGRLIVLATPEAHRELHERLSGMGN